MCGITGFLTIGGFPAAEAQRIVDAQTRTLFPTGARTTKARGWIRRRASRWVIAASSILDLSAAGHQPMASASGRYIIVLNGEIYNHLDIRARLEGADPAPAWRGHSDTETLQAAIERWGIESALGMAAGMFAFAVWDRREQTLILARDRMGEKPLYYGWQGRSLLFASELKAMRVHPEFSGAIDKNVLTDYMRRGYIGAPNCIYQGVHKLPPGTYLELSAGGTERRPACRRRRVIGRCARPWSKPAAIRSKATKRRRRTRWRSCWGSAVALQSIADVSLGAFLSGGDRFQFDRGADACAVRRSR